MKQPSWSQWIAVAALLGLIMLGLAWELWLAPVRPGGSWLVLKVLPLLLPLRGLLSGRVRTFQWTSMFVLLYLLEGITRLFASRGWGPWCAGVEVAFAVILYLAAIRYIRVCLRFKQQANADVSEKAQAV